MTSSGWEELVDEPAERLLVWMSETGAGPWAAFKRSAHDIESRVPSSRRLGAGPMMRRLSAAGHIEMDWEARRWSVAPPALATIPGVPHGALLVGARTGALYRRLHQLLTGDTDVDVFVDVRERARDRAIGVRPVYVLGRTRSEVLDAARYLSVPVVDHPARILATRLPRVTDHVLHARRAVPPPESTVKTFNPSTLAWPVGHPGQEVPVLAQHEPEMGATRFLLHTGTGILEVDRSYGIYAALASAHTNVLTWARADIHGELGVPTGAPLPALHARAARLCSGLEPDVVPTQFGPTRMYVNVPEDTAEALAATLEQRLHVLTSTTTGGP